MINMDNIPENTLGVEVCVSPKNVIYYKIETLNVTMSFMNRLEKDTNASIHICNSWNSLITHMGCISAKSEFVPVILLDISLFQRTDIMMQELISMMTTLHKCIFPGLHLQLGVVIERPCDASLLKEIRESEISGIVPWPTICGYKVTTESINNILTGKLYWPRNILQAVTKPAIINTPVKNGIVLTRRQLQVLGLIQGRGLSNKKIAQVLKITVSTVKSHISAILKEYGVQNRTQLALAANSGLYAPAITNTGV